MCMLLNALAMQSIHFAKEKYGILSSMRKMIKWTVIITSILLLLRAYTHFKTVAAPIPPGVTMANLEISQIKDPSQIREHLERVYSQPFFVDFAGQSLVIDPAEIGFHVEVEQMMWEASRYLYGPDFIEISLRAVAGLPQRQRDIPLRYTIDTEKLRAWLTETAAEQNSEPSLARLAPPSEQWVNGPLDSNALSADFVGTFARDWQWVAGASGYRLDVEASIPAVINGILLQNELTPNKSTIELAYIEQQPEPPSMADLQRAIDNYLSNFPGFAAAYVYDIPNQEEANVDADVSFSGMSTLKISLAAAVMQQMDGLPAGRKSYEIGMAIPQEARAALQHLCASLALRIRSCNLATMQRFNYPSYQHQAISARIGIQIPIATYNLPPPKWGAYWLQFMTARRARAYCSKFSPMSLRPRSVSIFSFILATMSFKSWHGRECLAQMIRGLFTSMASPMKVIATWRWCGGQQGHIY